MPQENAGSLDAKISTAKAVVDCLVSIASGYESDEWMAKFHLVKCALDEGRLRDAIREESKLTSSRSSARSEISGGLAKMLEEAMAVLLRHLHYPGHVEPAMELGELPKSVTVPKTITAPDSLFIRNCRIRFRYQCPKTWEQLPPGADMAIRHCEQCQKDVFLCRSPDEWEAHSKAGHCVALEGFSPLPLRLLGFPDYSGDADREVSDVHL